jgi:Family of unknown function (DUF5931)
MWRSSPSGPSVVTWAHDRYAEGKGPWLVADLLVAVVALLSTPVAQSRAQLDGSDASIPTFWVSSSLIAWAVHWRLRGGIAAAVAISVADLSIRAVVDTDMVANIFLLFLTAGVVGYCTGLLFEAADARTEAEPLAAAAAERERLARDVHDGVLQVLALVRRRGIEAGGAADELGRLAGEQEIALRHLLRRPAGRQCHRKRVGMSTSPSCSMCWRAATSRCRHLAGRCGSRRASDTRSRAPCGRRSTTPPPTPGRRRGRGCWSRRPVTRSWSACATTAPASWRAAWTRPMPRGGWASAGRSEGGSRRQCRPGHRTRHGGRVGVQRAAACLNSPTRA